MSGCDKISYFQISRNSEELQTNIVLKIACINYRNKKHKAELTRFPHDICMAAIS